MVKFFLNKPPTVVVTGSPIGVGKFERQLVNIYRAINQSKLSARHAAAGHMKEMRDAD